MTDEKKKAKQLIDAHYKILKMNDLNIVEGYYLPLLEQAKLHALFTAKQLEKLDKRMLGSKWDIAWPKKYWAEIKKYIINYKSQLQ